jgi:hypothetical protein
MHVDSYPVVDVHILIGFVKDLFLKNQSKKRMPRFFTSLMLITKADAHASV